MSLPADRRLGQYEILALLGAGGMGEVYRARDTRLGRGVAIKLIRDRFASDPEARARFAREARAASALNHPNICTVHDVGREGDVDYLVMELLEGETLASRLRRGPLPLDQVLRYGAQIADALRRAHANGITHRDLKPGNIMLTKDGAKLVDFGLAGHSAAVPSAEGETRTVSVGGPRTAEGALLGTIQYMAPEQLRGQRADERSDLWGLGAVLYEMAAGRPAFHAPDHASLIASIMHHDPDPVSPAALDQVIRGLLAKDPDERFQNGQDVRLALGWIAAGGRTAGTAPRARPWLARTSTWVGAALALAASVAGYGLGRRAEPPGPPRIGPPLHSVIPLPPESYLAGWGSPAVALSPDGRNLAFVAMEPGRGQRLHVRRLDRDETLIVPGSEEAEGPMFSPDGQWIAFAVGVSGGRRSGELLKYSLASGLTQSICPLSDFFGGQWLPDGTILLVENLSRGLWSVSAEGGRLRSIVARFHVDGKETERRLKWPQALPGGRRVIASSHGKVCVIDLQTGELRDTGIASSFARYARTGHLLYATADSTLMVAPFNAGRGTATGQGVAAIRGVSFTANGASVFAMSDNGALVYGTGPVRGSGSEISNIVRITRRGALEVLPIEPANLSDCSIAPDGRRLAVDSDGDVWIYDLERRTRQMLPRFSVNGRGYLAWTPDGRSVAFRGTQPGGQADYDLFLQRADGGSPPMRLGGTPVEDQTGSITPDGRTLLFGTFDSQADGQSAIWSIPTDGKGSPRQLSSGADRERSPRVSPDGRMIAYEGLQAGRIEIFLATYPEFGSPVSVSAGGGYLPRWSPDGRELYFARGGWIEAVSVDPGPPPRVGAPRRAVDLAGSSTFDVLPDGSGFIGLRSDPKAGRLTKLRLVANWFPGAGDAAGSLKSAR